MMIPCHVSGNIIPKWARIVAIPVTMAVTVVFHSVNMSGSLSGSLESRFITIAGHFNGFLRIKLIVAHLAAVDVTIVK